MTKYLTLSFALGLCGVCFGDLDVRVNRQPVSDVDGGGMADIAVAGGSLFRLDVIWDGGRSMADVGDRWLVNLLSFSEPDDYWQHGIVEATPAPYTWGSDWFSVEGAELVLSDRRVEPNLEENAFRYVAWYQKTGEIPAGAILGTFAVRTESVLIDDELPDLAIESPNHVWNYSSTDGIREYVVGAAAYRRDFDVQLTSIPEPSAYLLCAIAILTSFACMALIRRTQL